MTPLYGVYGLAHGMCTAKRRHDRRTNSTMSAKLMAATLKATGPQTRREAVEQEPLTPLRQKRQTDRRKLSGKHERADDRDSIRRDK